MSRLALAGCDVLGIDWGDAGKQAFGVLHTGGKAVASAFGQGQAAMNLEKAESEAGLLPDWAVTPPATQPQPPPGGQAGPKSPPGGGAPSRPTSPGAPSLPSAQVRSLRVKPRPPSRSWVVPVAVGGGVLALGTIGYLAVRR